MARKTEASSGKGTDPSGGNRWKRDCPDPEEVRDVEERLKELKHKLQKATDPLEHRRLEQEIKVLGWRLQRLRVRPHTPG